MFYQINPFTMANNLSLKQIHAEKTRKLRADAIEVPWGVPAGSFTEKIGEIAVLRRAMTGGIEGDPESYRKTHEDWRSKMSDFRMELCKFPRPSELIEISEKIEEGLKICGDYLATAEDKERALYVCTRSLYGLQVMLEIRGQRQFSTEEELVRFLDEA
jgi:hypothetical protein